MAGKTLIDRISDAQQEKQRRRWTEEERKRWGLEGETPGSQRETDKEKMESGGGGGEAKG